MFLKHKIYGLFFNIFRVFPLKSNKVSFITDKKGTFEGNFHYIAKELSDRKTKEGKLFDCYYIPKDNISIKNMYNLATSRYVFLADNFFPMAFMKFHNDVIIVQLWHASGLFKKFGYDFVDNEYKQLMEIIGERINYLLVSSKNISEIYAHNFAMDIKKTIPFGTPKLDYYDDFRKSESNKSRIRDEFKKNYPNIKDKKIVLYAPTFRETPKYNNVFDYFDLKKFIDELSDEYILFVRLHPKMKNFSDMNFDYFLNNPNIVNVGDYQDEQELLIVSDMLITDYSSFMAEYSLLHKPIVFFTYDLENYIKNERGFYIDFDNDLPGNVVSDIDQLISLFKSKEFDLTRIDKFLDFQFEYLDSNATKRLVDFVFKD